MGDENDEARPRPGCVRLLMDEEYAAVLLVRWLSQWGNEEVGKCGNEGPCVGGEDMDQPKCKCYD